MKTLNIEDYEKIKLYLDMANYEGYNSNFVTMMMWNHEYHIQYEIHDNFMVMLHNYKGNQFWAMPFTSPEFYQEAIEYMLNYSQQHDFPFKIDCAIEEFVDKIKPLYHDIFLFERTPYNDDYIYDRMMHQTLSGKKMQKRRNHYNAFIKKHPDYIYRDLDLVNDFDTILNCLNRWEYEKDTLSESMTSEVRGIMALLSSKHLLDFEVGGIFIEGQMEAFIIASRLKHSTIQIHVEKANKEIRGLYPAILKEMLEHYYPDELFINREEDMGLENLRKSKLSLHPVKMIRKYSIALKNPVIRLAEEKDKDDIIQLWKDCFLDETNESTQYYFENLYQSEHTYIYENNHQIISVLQIVPMPLMIQYQEERCYFILGVCTHKNWTGQGCMKELLNHVLELYKDKRIYLQAYVPEIYYRFGFRASHYHQRIKADKSALDCIDIVNPINDKSLLNGYYEAYTQNFDEYRIRDASYWELFIKRCEVFGQNILIFENLGYFVYQENETSIDISEIIYLNQGAVNQMLAYFKDSKKEIIVECDMNICIQGDKEDVITMLSSSKNQSSIFKNKYINEIY